MKILITGGAGMIGSNLVRALMAKGNHVQVVDSLWRGRREHLQFHGDHTFDMQRDFFQLDLRQPGVVENIGDGFDLIFHLADIVAGINYVFANEGAIFRDNILINSNVVDSARRLKPKGFIYVGTACSFPKALQNTDAAIALREEQLFPADPESAYGWSKLMGIYETELMARETGIKCCNLIFHNVYGSPCDFGPRSQVIPALIRKCLRYPNEDFVVWGSGNQGRAFLHVDDVVRGLLLAMERGWDVGPIQIGPSHCTTIREIAETIVRISGKAIPIKYDDTKPEGDRSRCADYSKAARVLGWKPEVNLEDGLRQLYQWSQTQLLAEGKPD